MLGDRHRLRQHGVAVLAAVRHRVAHHLGNGHEFGEASVGLEPEGGVGGAEVGPPAAAPAAASAPQAGAGDHPLPELQRHAGAPVDHAAEHLVADHHRTPGRHQVGAVEELVDVGAADAGPAQRENDHARAGPGRLGNVLDAHISAPVVHGRAHQPDARSASPKSRSGVIGSRDTSTPRGPRASATALATAAGAAVAPLSPTPRKPSPTTEGMSR